MGNMEQEATIEELDRLAIEFSTFRKKPLLILYYHEFEGEMREDDVEHICQEIKRRGFHRENKLQGLDVLLHTIGGDPHAGYRIAQLLRGVTPQITFLVPEYAFSAGTLSCMCGNEVRLGECAVLSPFDISFSGRRQTENIELMSNRLFQEFCDRFS
jgi:ATP-dependent protease ClpP protease subunit